MEGRPLFLGNSSSCPALVDGSLFSESDWLTEGSAVSGDPLVMGALPNPEELASSGPAASTSSLGFLAGLPSASGRGVHVKI